MSLDNAEEIMIQYLLFKVEQKDWHGVSDAANDLREMQAKKEKKEWVGLTDEEITEIRLKMFDAVAMNYDTYRAIEAKLREKNK